MNELVLGETCKVFGTHVAQYILKNGKPVRRSIMGVFVHYYLYIPTLVNDENKNDPNFGTHKHWVGEWSVEK